MTKHLLSCTLILRYMAAVALFLVCGMSISAQHRTKNTDIPSRLREMGVSMSDLSYQRAQKLMAGYHPLLMNGHRGSKTQKAGKKYEVQGTKSPLLAAQKAGAAENMTIYGYLAFANNWEEDLYGLYKFNTVPPITFERMPNPADGPVAADGGGCYYDGKYYSVTYAGFMGLVLAEFCVYDTETWSMEKYIPCDAGSVSVDMDFDATTGNIYGCFYNSSFDGVVFGRMNPETGATTPISSLNRIFFGIAVNSKGEVFGLDEEGNLSKFNKVTGERTVVGNTGLKQEYLGGATFDKKTDRLYWSFVTETSSALYEVDTKTAEATLVCQFPHMEEVQGMYIPIPAAEPGAPAKAEELKATFEGPSLSGTLAFRLPNKTYSGDNLSGELEYEIFVNDEPFSTGQAKAGDMVEAKVEVKTYGSYKLGVRSKNAIGESPIINTSLWIGKDTPKAVGNLKAEDGEEPGDVIISWTAPTESEHGGYLDIEGIEYRVLRIKDGGRATAIATTKELSYKDHIVNEGPIVPYTYRVVPIIDLMRMGEAATSNSIGVGAALELPYHQAFDDERSFDILTIIDRHNDGKTWEYDATFQAARAQYDWTNAKNEWLITPPLHMTAERVYKLSYDSWCRSGEKERLEVKYGQGKKHTDMTVTILPRTDIANDTPENRFHLVTIAADGDYNFGFHAVSDVDKWWLYLDNISIEAGPLLGTPNGVLNMTATPAEKGALNATLSFTTPKTTVDGKTLENISGIKIYRNGTLIETIAATEVGKEMTYTDVNAIQGDNTYMAVPFNTNGDGLETERTCYVGVGVPMAPTNVTLRKVDGQPVLTWEAPTSGIGGTYIDPEDLLYSIVRNDSKVVAYRTEGLSFTDTTLDTDDEQAFVTYAVFAESAAGMDMEEFGMSNEICFGTPYELPFHESFAGVSLEAGPWTWDILEGDPYMQIVASGDYPVTEAQDKDGGMLTFKPENKGEEALLYSANISLVDAQNPKLSFWYYNNPGTFDKISARIRLDDDPTMVDEVAYINMNSTSGPEGWTEMTCDLTRYVGHRIQIIFDFLSSSDFYIHLDNISVTGLRNDLPYVNDLSGAFADGVVSLEWSEPVDEIGLGFIGFNVYRNGVLLNEEPLVDPMYEDETAGAGTETYTYQVTVVYTEGETCFSNPFIYTPTGIDGIAAQEGKGNTYDLLGRRLTNVPKRSVLLQAGRKMLTGK